jgi:hypothetical protein
MVPLGLVDAIVDRRDRHSLAENDLRSRRDPRAETVR